MIDIFAKDNGFKMKRSLSNLGDGYLLDKRTMDVLGNGNLLRSMNNLGQGNLLRSLDLGRGNLLRSLDLLGHGNLLRFYKKNLDLRIEIF